MRIRAAFAASALAATIVMGGASATLAHGKDHKDRHHHCWFFAGIKHGEPVFSEGCGKGRK